MFAVKFGLRIFIDPPGAVHLCWPESSSNDLNIYMCVCVCVCVAIGEKIETVLLSLQACFVIAHSSWDFLFFPPIAAYISL